MLQDDGEIKDIVKKKEPEVLSKVKEIIEEEKSHYINPIAYEIALERQKEAK